MLLVYIYLRYICHPERSAATVAERGKMRHPARSRMDPPKPQRCSRPDTIRREGFRSRSDRPNTQRETQQRRFRANVPSCRCYGTNHPTASVLKRPVFRQLIYKLLGKLGALGMLKVRDSRVALNKLIQLVAIIEDFDLKLLPPDPDRSPISFGDAFGNRAPEPARPDEIPRVSDRCGSEGLRAGRNGLSYCCFNRVPFDH